MAELNQLTVSPQVLPPQSGDSGLSLSASQSRKATWLRTAVMLAAWVEIIVGVSFVLALNVQSPFVFGVMPEGVGDTWARFAGVALIGLGIACLPSNSDGGNRGAARGLLVFNIGATIFFAWVAMATTFQGVLLWPVVGLHAVLTVALALALRHKDF